MRNIESINGGINGEKLVQLDLPTTINFTVEQILPQGLFVLAGAPKTGKSFLALQIASSVSSGHDIWGFKSARGKVLYIAYEDTLQRAKSRLAQQPYAEPKNIDFILRPGDDMTQTLSDKIINFIGREDDTRLIVIDTLELARGSSSDKSPYRNDYMFMEKLQNILTTIGKNMGHAPFTAILTLTHTRKMGDNDPLNTISGTNGIRGGSDGNWVLIRDFDSPYGTLNIENRDTDSFKLNLEFDKERLQWLYRGKKGEDTTVKQSNIADIVAEYLRNHAEFEGTAAELSDALLSEKLCRDGDYTPTTLSTKLRDNAGILLHKYGITYNVRDKRRNGSHGKVISFSLTRA